LLLQDIHAPFTTVREALEFSAALRLPATVTRAQRQAFVAEVLHILELTDLADRLVGRIGGPEALAPGQRKRLTIGVELVSNAPVIFLDEPTSGLDSRSAAEVIRVIRCELSFNDSPWHLTPHHRRNIANRGRTVICTVHQPSQALFYQFDDLLLLQRGGWQVYVIKMKGDCLRDIKSCRCTWVR
jgi:ABC-type multidrug transport system ATPase subunit